jgi:hypothetical protein
MTSPWTALIGLVATLFRTLAHGSWLWVAGVANLVVAGLLLALAWILHAQPQPRRRVAAVFLVVGLVLTFAAAARFSFSGTFFPLGIAEFLTPDSRIAIVAAFAGALGLAGVLPQKEGHDRVA